MISNQSKWLISLAGLPATIVRSGTFLITTPRAPTIAPSPIFTPGPTKASAQIQTLSPIVIGGFVSGLWAWR
jgi:hypothetical protein